MPLLNNEIARRENGRLEVRTSPVRVRWNLDDLVTADGHKLHCAFTCSVAALAEASEKQMLEEVFLGGARPTRAPAAGEPLEAMIRPAIVTTAAVAAHFAPGLRAAAGKAAGKHAAADLVEAEQSQPMVDALVEAGKAIAFSAGVDLLAPFEVSVESPTFRTQRVEEMERTLAERRVAGQVEHFERASKLLRDFEQLRKAAPELTAADVLKQVSPADQGMMLQTLLLAAGKAGSTACLWAVAGPSLIRVDGRATPVALEMMPLPPTLGPLRSVQPARLDGRDVLLVGARSGIMVFDPKTNQSQAYQDASIQSQLGFSKAVLWGGQIWGVHGEAGVVAWKMDQPGSPIVIMRPVDLRGANNPPPVPMSPPPSSPMSIAVRTSGIRNLTVLDEGRLVLSVGHVLVVIDAAGGRTSVELPGESEVAGIFVDGHRAVIVRDDGTVDLRDRATLESISQQRKAGRVTAAAMLPWLGSNRLLLASDEGPVYCVGLDDEVVTTYASGHRGLRVLAAAPDLVAAVSSDRQRLVLWNSWDGKKPLAELSLWATAKHRVGDVEFA